MSISEAAVYAATDRIDARLMGEGVPISKRQGMGSRFLCRELGVGEIDYSLSDELRLPDGTTNVWACYHKWFRERYGEKLDGGFGPGCIAVQLRGDIWRLRIPWIMGVVSVGVGPGGIVEVSMSTQDPVRGLSLFDCIEDLTPEMQRSLQHLEVQYLVEMHQLGSDALRAVVSLEPDSLVSAARADLEGAIDQLLTTKPHPGQSQWCSLQAIEKLMKAKIASRGGISAEKQHKLAKIAKELEATGHRAIPSNLIDQIQCDAGTRYGETPTSVAKAIAAHHASMRIAVLLGK